jgi:hypothetical protein
MKPQNRSTDASLTSKRSQFIKSMGEEAYLKSFENHLKEQQLTNEQKFEEYYRTRQTIIS